MSKFFPPTLTSERIGEIIVFKQGEEKSLFNAWERFQRLKNYLGGSINEVDPDCEKGKEFC